MKEQPERRLPSTPSHHSEFHAYLVWPSFVQAPKNTALCHLLIYFFSHLLTTFLETKPAFKFMKKWYLLLNTLN